MNEKRLLDQFNDYLEQYKVLHEDFKDVLKQWMIRAMRDGFERGKKETDHTAGFTPRK